MEPFEYSFSRAVRGYAAIAVALNLCLLDKELRRGAQSPRSSTLLNSDISTLDFGLGAGPARLTAATADLSNLTAITGTLGHTWFDRGHVDDQLCNKCIVCITESSGLVPSDKLAVTPSR